MGEIEVEYEGTEAFLRDELPELLSAVSKLYYDSGRPKPNGAAGSTGVTPPAGLQGTTATIAAKLKCKPGVGRDLITAAAARLTFAANRESFTRADLLAEAKTASAYYKTTVNNNLTNTLDGLVKAGDFTEIAKGTYALSATKREALSASLAS